MYINDFKKRIIYWVVLTIIPVIFIVPMYFFTGVTLANLFTVVGVIYLGCAGLVFVHRCGVFDTFEYQFNSWIYSFRKGSPKKYESASDYHLIQNDKRQTNKFVYLPFFVYGGLYLIIGIIIGIIYSFGK